MEKKNNLLYKILILISALGLLAFIFITNFPLKKTLFGLLYKKPASFADEVLGVPTVDLKVIQNGVSSDGTISSPLNQAFTLVWEAKGNPGSCFGNSWGVSATDESWDGPKSTTGGSFTTPLLNKPNPYVYSINCQNEKGDSTGDAITINLGTLPSNVSPYITSLEVNSDSLLKKDKSMQLVLPQGDEIDITWNVLNVQTPYSICISTGSWPTAYKNIGSSTVKERFKLDDEKIYKYTIYCSNESSYTKVPVTIVSQ